MKADVPLTRDPSPPRRRRIPPFGSWYLWLQAGFLLVGFRVALWAVPFRVIIRTIDRVPAMRRPRAPHPADRIARAVSALSRRMFRERPCLTQALALLVLYRRSGHPATLRIGVALNSRGKLLAHAWVESEGNVVIGRLANLSEYTPLPPIDSAVSALK